MHEPRIRLVRRLRCIGLGIIIAIAIGIGAVPASLSGQGTALSQQPRITSPQPFATYDDSLLKGAETLLASAAQTTATATHEVVVDQAPDAKPATDHDRRLRSWTDAGLQVASTRLDLLRPTVEPILRSHGVPSDLAAVILVESGGRAATLSPKGARGLWQLMPATARRYGLRVDELRDDRLDLFKATDAAARYLHDLYAQFGDWRLALAAYNTGEANVGSAILRAHTQDFDRLSRLRMLPAETRNYVPSVLAAAQSILQLPPIEPGHHTIVPTTVFAVSTP